MKKLMFCEPLELKLFGHQLPPRGTLRKVTFPWLSELTSKCLILLFWTRYYMIKKLFLNTFRKRIYLYQHIILNCNYVHTYFSIVIRAILWLIMILQLKRSLNNVVAKLIWLCLEPVQVEPSQVITQSEPAGLTG